MKVECDGGGGGRVGGLGGQESKLTRGPDEVVQEECRHECI